MCVKACKIFDQYHKIPFDLSIHLHKIIPMGAGLGGGSSNAAEVLKSLNCLTGSKLSSEELLSMAAELGSDCSFFIHKFPAFAEGRGEILSKFDLDLSKYFMVLVKPDVHVSTAAAFSGIIAGKNNHNLKNCLLKPIQQWQNCLVNDFEETVVRNFPVIREIKARLLSLGAVYAAMSGSGSTVYGLFDSFPPSADHFKDCSYFCFKK
ncbi:MAG: 4-(cytidine 5'-diphospho)-2-C-methyl-D-erythritol kinase [Bacteroidetes bacterium]|nr:4-(cytidine 5'-diphospho)-2-C-methyl-D-erythritol kinase [Bacteroidota bacterium]